MSFYKSVNEIAPNAWNEYINQSKVMISELEKFASHFDAKPVIGFSYSCHTYHGLALNNYESREDRDLWTIPRKQNKMASTVRSSIKNKNKKEELKTLQDKYNQLKPNLFKVNSDDLLIAVGTDWGQILFFGISWHMVNNILYVETSIKLNKNMQEILGSEYREAIANKDVSHA